LARSSASKLEALFKEFQPDVRSALLDELREADGHAAAELSIGEFAGLRLSAFA
jgi:hypothetical protein